MTITTPEGLAEQFPEMRGSTCPECGSTRASWSYGPGGFALGCDECSETLGLREGSDICEVLDLLRGLRTPQAPPTLADIHRAISDPGAFVERNRAMDVFGPDESISHWSARAVMAVLAQAPDPAPVCPRVPADEAVANLSRVALASACTFPAPEYVPERHPKSTRTLRGHVATPAPEQVDDESEAVAWIIEGECPVRLGAVVKASDKGRVDTVALTMAEARAVVALLHPCTPSPAPCPDDDEEQVAQAIFLARIVGPKDDWALRDAQEHNDLSWKSAIAEARAALAVMPPRLTRDELALTICYQQGHGDDAPDEACPVCVRTADAILTAMTKEEER